MTWQSKLSPAQRSRMRSDSSHDDLFLDDLRDAQIKAAAVEGDKTRRYEAGKAVVRRMTRDPDTYTDAIKGVARRIRY